MPAPRRAPDASIKKGDIVSARVDTGIFHAVVVTKRLGRLVIERCDGRPSAPLLTRDVIEVYKPVGKPKSARPETERLRPNPQLQIELDD